MTHLRYTLTDKENWLGIRSFRRNKALFLNNDNTSSITKKYADIPNMLLNKK